MQPCREIVFALTNVHHLEIINTKLLEWQQTPFDPSSERSPVKLGLARDLIHEPVRQKHSPHCCLIRLHETQLGYNNPHNYRQMTKLRKHQHKVS
jgi:hypothetical protein